MSDDSRTDTVEFDEFMALALAIAASKAQPSTAVRQRVMTAVSVEPVPQGFSFRFVADPDWLPHPVPGIRMKVLALNREGGYATLLLDVAPGTRFHAHHHTGDEECYVISGSLVACGRRIGPGDFHHADAGSDHGELWTDEGCRVLLIVPPEDYMPDASASATRD